MRIYKNPAMKERAGELRGHMTPQEDAPLELLSEASPCADLPPICHRKLHR